MQSQEGLRNPLSHALTLSSPVHPYKQDSLPLHGEVHNLWSYGLQFKCIPVLSLFFKTFNFLNLLCKIGGNA